MKIRVYTVCKNERAMMPFFLRHYLTFADSIVVYDAGSTDGTLDLLLPQPSVEVRPCPYAGLDDVASLKLSMTAYRESEGQFDWVMWVDCDEFIWADSVPRVLETLTTFDVAMPAGFNMICEGLPEDDGKSQIWQLCPMGVRAPVYGKPVVFRPNVEMRWNLGRHAIEHVTPKLTPAYVLRLLHYRYLGYNYTRARNLRNYEAVGPDKGAAWTCNPDWNGEHSARWAEEMLKHRFNVLEFCLRDF